MRKILTILKGFLFAIICFGFNLSWADAIHLIQLKYRDAQEIIPLLRPMLSPGGKVSGSGLRLLIRTDGQNLYQIKQVISKIDTKPQTLRISVKVNNRVGERMNRLINHFQSGGVANQIKFISVLEGRGAWISQGQDVPVANVLVGPFWQSVLQDYRRVKSGFWVVPYMRGDQVELTILHKNERLQPNSVVDLQNAATSMMIPFGAWRVIGGQLGSQEYLRRTNMLKYKYSTRSLDRILIRVDRAR